MISRLPESRRGFLDAEDSLLESIAAKSLARTLASAGGLFLELGRGKDDYSKGAWLALMFFLTRHGKLEAWKDAGQKEDAGRL